MKNKLLITTALVAVAFASGALAADVNITANDELQNYANSPEAHQEWVDNVSVKGLEADTVQAGYIQADKLNIEDSTLTVKGEGVFISGASQTDVNGNSTVSLEEKGSLLSAYDNGRVNQMNINGAVDSKGGIIRAASNADGSQYSAININGTVTASDADNVIGSRLTNVNGALNIASGAVLDLVGDLTRDSNTGFVSVDDAAKAKDGVMNIAQNGKIDNKGTLNANSVLIKNNGLIDNQGTVNLGDYESNGGYLGSETVDNTINITGDINLQNNARIVAATARDEGAINITGAENIKLSNGSTIDAVKLKIEGTSKEDATKITVGGNNANAGRDKNGETWRNNSYILSYDDGSISNAEIDVNNGGHIMQGGLTAGDNRTMTVKDSKINLNEGGSLRAIDGAKFALNGSEVNLNGGQIKALIDGTNSSSINVNNAASTIYKIAALDDLNTAVDTAISKLLEEDSKVTNLNVKSGTFTLDGGDDVATLTAENLNVDGTAKVAADYSIADTTVNKGGTLEVAQGVTYTSDVAMKGGSTLNIGVGQTADDEPALSYGKITGTVTGESDEAKGSMNLVFDANMDSALLEGATLDVATSVTDVDLNDNILYAYDKEDWANGNIKVTKNGQDAVVAGLAEAGVAANQSGTLAAFTSSTSGHATADAITKQMSDLIQTGNTDAASVMAQAVAPETAPMVQSVSTETANQIFGAVGTRLSGGSISSVSEGKSAGDNIFERAAVWVQGLINKSKLSKHNQSFDADSQGVAFGAEKYINDDVKVGIGYAYTNTDVDAFMRSTDIDTHSAILYGEYKPSNWYVNGIASYGWSDYEETKNVGGAFVKGKYDVDTIGLQAMTGYEFNHNNYKFTPEAGLRYVNIHQDSYTDSAGQRIKTDSSDILTGVIGAKAETTVALDSGMTLKPEARLAMTYDLMNDDSSSIVTLANGSAYQVNGKALDRFGVEFGAGVTADVSDDVELSIGYEGKFRQDYQDHTGLLNAKYKF